MGSSVDFDSSSEEFINDYAAWALETGLWDGRSVSTQDATLFSQEVALRIATLLESESEEPTTFDLLAIQFARMGTTNPEELALIDREIAELKITPDGQIVQVGFGKWCSKFWKKHKVAVITGVVVVAVAVAVVAVTVSSAGTATGAAVSGASTALSNLDTLKKNDHSQEKKFEHNPGPIPQAQTPELALSKQELSASINPSSNFNFQQNGLLVGDRVVPYSDLIQQMQQTSIFPHAPNSSQRPTPSWLTQTLVNDLPEAPKLENASPWFSQRWAGERQPSEVPKFVESFFQAESFNPNTPNPQFSSFMYQWRGENAFQLGQFDKAIADYSKAIQLTPNDPDLYLDRGMTHFELGQYDRSVADYNEYASQLPKEQSFSVPEFSLGFAKGLPNGIYDSGTGIFLLISDIVKHPIDTSKQMYESLSMLSQLVRSEDWNTISQTLAPEIHQLVREWDTLPSEKRGELAGYAFGKYGADILIPGALAKTIGKGVQGAKQFAVLYDTLKTSEKALVLEAVAEFSNQAKVAELLNTTKQTLVLGEELGFSAQEIGKLKQTGQFERSIKYTYEQMLNNPCFHQSLELFKKAEQALKEHSRKFITEIEARALIEAQNITTFPRPLGIPDNFLVRITDRGAGIEYVHPTNSQISIRVMPGKPHSPYPKQQKPYVVYKKNGKAFDNLGNILEQNDPNVHIPLEEFIYRE